MTELADLTVKLRADAASFQKQIDGAITQMSTFEKTVERSTERQRTFANALKGTATELNSVWSIAQRVTGVFEGMYRAAAEGARNTVAREFFENAGKSLDEYRRATRGLISDADLIKKANLADSMGISGEAFQRLSLIAHAASLKTGQSFEYMFNSIITGSARSSRLLLDNLGIIVSVKQANEQYAASLHKTVEELSAEEKQQAFINAVMQASEGQIKELDEVTNNLASTYDQLEASAKNAGDALRESLAKGLSGAAASLRDWLDAWTGLDESSRLFMLAGAGIGAGALGATGAVIGAPAWATALIALLGGGAVASTIALGEQNKQSRADALDQALIPKVIDEIYGKKRLFEDGGQSYVAREGGLPADMQRLLAEQFKGGTLTQQLVALSEAELTDMANQLRQRSLDYIGKAADVSQEFADKFLERIAFLKKVGLSPAERAFAGGSGDSAPSPVQRGGRGGGSSGEASPRFDWKKALLREAMVVLGIDETSHAADMSVAKQIDEQFQMWLAGLSDVQKQLWERAGEIALAQGGSPWDHTAQTAVYERLLASQERVDEAAKELADRLNEASWAQAKWTEAQKQINAVSPGVQALAQGDAGGAIGALTGALSSMLGDSASALSSTLSTVLGEMAGPIGAIIALLLNIVGPLIAALKPVTDIVTALGDALGNVVRFGLTDLFNTLRPVMPALRLLGVALGTVIADLVSSFLPTIRLGVGALTTFLEVMSVVIMVLSPFIAVWGQFVDLGAHILVSLLQLIPGFDRMQAALGTSADYFVRVAVTLHNAIVRMIRQIPTQEKFGKILDLRDVRAAVFGEDTGKDTDDQNTEATEENTKALRDLAREFRNLPSGYKIAGADFATSREAVAQQSASLAVDMGFNASDLFRWRR